MDIETIQKIIEMLGSATESAATVAILWVIGGHLVTLISWGLSFYLIKYIAELAYKLLSAGVTKEEYNEVADKLRMKERLLKNEEARADIAAEKHKAELEKVQHLYKILKESK